MKHLAFVFVLSSLLPACMTGCSRNPAPRDEASRDESRDGQPSIHEVVVIEVDEQYSPEATPARPARPSKPARPIAGRGGKPRLPKARPTTPPAPKATTPKAAATPPAPKGGTVAGEDTDALRLPLINMAKALETSDKALFMSCIAAAAEDKPYVEALFEAAAVVGVLQARMIKAYGEDALKSGKLKTLSGMPTVDEMKTKVKFQVDGDKAVAIMGGKAQPLSLVKKSGKWLLAMPAPTDDQARATAVKMMKTLKFVAEQACAKVGKKGYTPEKIFDEIMAAQMNTMMMEAAEKKKPARKRGAPRKTRAP